MKLSNLEIFKAFDCLTELKSLKLKTILKFKIARNLKILGPIKESLDEARNGSDVPGAVEFEAERKEKFRSYSDDGQTISGPDIARYEADLAELQKKYADTLAELETRQKEYKKLLEKKEEVSIFLLDLEDFPEEIEVDIEPLLPFIKEG